MTRTEQLIGTGDIAQMLGVSRQRVDQLSRRSDFPEPVGRISGGRVWQLKDVERWADKRSA